MISFFGELRRSAGFREGWARPVAGRARSAAGGVTDTSDSRCGAPSEGGHAMGPGLARRVEPLSRRPRTIAPAVAPARIRSSLPAPRATLITPSAAPSTRLCPATGVRPVRTTRGDASLASDHCRVNAGVLAVPLLYKNVMANCSVKMSPHGDLHDEQEG